MYSRRVTAQMIAATNAAQGWDLQPHSATEIAAAIAHFEDLMSDEGQLTRPLTTEEARELAADLNAAADELEDQPANA